MALVFASELVVLPQVFASLSKGGTCQKVERKECAKGVALKEPTSSNGAFILCIFLEPYQHLGTFL